MAETRAMRGGIPVVAPEKLIEAMHRFDNEIRHLPRWATWEQNGLHKFAIQYQGRLYPIKQIISLATGKSYTEFSGGNRTNNYVRQLGFPVVMLSRDQASSEQNPNPEVEETGSQASENLSHTHIQWLLAKIGTKLGCRVWIASNDQAKIWSGETLSSLSLKALPQLGLGVPSQKLIQLIDVLWMRNHQVVAAFEVENTTSIYSGLLRLADLTAVSPSLNFRLYIVAPEARLDKVQKELSRPSIQKLELHERCGYFSHEELVKESESIMKWANDSGAIDRLASRVGPVSFA